MSSLIAETPIAVVDFETTGLNAGPDRVVEVAVVRLDPGEPPRLAVNSLVNPNRRMAATEIHGITDDDVRDAPLFEDLAAGFLSAVNGAVLASYNVYFDIRFLEHELGRVGVREVPPHLCLMYLRPLLGLGKKCSLDVVCQQHGISRASSHQAAADAMHGAALWGVYTEAMRARGIRSLADLCSLAQYKFLDSLGSPPFGPRAVAGLRLGATPKPRPVSANGGNSQTPSLSARPVPSRQVALRRYWEELKVVLADLDVSRDEIRELRALRQDLRLAEPEMRAMHGKAFADLLSQTIEDRVLDVAESEQLRRLYACLSRLGWAPGQ